MKSIHCKSLYTINNYPKLIKIVLDSYFSFLYTLYYKEVVFMENTASRFKPINVIGRDRISKILPQISVTHEYIYFNKVAREMFFKNEVVVYCDILYDDVANEYLIIDLQATSDMIRPPFFIIRNGRLNNGVLSREILGRLGQYPIISSSPEGMILSAQPKDRNDA